MAGENFRTNSDISQSTTKNNTLIVPPGSPEDLKQGVSYDGIAEIIASASITLQNLEARVDISNLTNYMNTHGSPGINVKERIKAGTINLNELITMICDKYSLGWRADFMFSGDGETVIVVKVFDNSRQIVGIPFSDIVENHAGNIIGHREGYTYKTRSASKLLYIPMCMD